MAGPYLRLGEGLGPAVREAYGGTVSWPWSAFSPGNAPVAGGEFSPSAGIQGPVWAGQWVVFETLYLHATEEEGPWDGIWLGTECLLL